jgi:hypothetical protein
MLYPRVAVATSAAAKWDVGHSLYYVAHYAASEVQVKPVPHGRDGAHLSYALVEWGAAALFAPARVGLVGAGYRSC